MWVPCSLASGALPYFLVDTGNFWLIVLGITGGLVFLGMMYGPQAAFHRIVFNRSAILRCLWAIRSVRYWVELLRRLSPPFCGRNTISSGYQRILRWLRVGVNFSHDANRDLPD